MSELRPCDLFSNPAMNADQFSSSGVFVTFVGTKVREKTIDLEIENNHQEYFKWSFLYQPNASLCENPG